VQLSAASMAARSAMFGVALLNGSWLPLTIWHHD
jgi:hypothetical protein